MSLIRFSRRALSSALARGSSLSGARCIAIMYPAIPSRKYSTKKRQTYGIPFPDYGTTVKRGVLALEISSYETFKKATKDDATEEEAKYLDDKTVERLYLATVGWHGAIQRNKTNNPRLLEELGVTERDFFLAKFLVPFHAITPKASYFTWAFQTGMAVFAAALGHEPAILSLAYTYWQRQMRLVQPGAPEVREPVYAALNAIAPNFDVPDNIAANARALSVMMSIWRGRRDREARDALEYVLGFKDGEVQEERMVEFEWRRQALVVLGMLLRADGEHDRARAIFAMVADKYKAREAHAAMVRDPENHDDEWTLLDAMRGSREACYSMSNHVHGLAARAQESKDGAAFREKQVIAGEWRRLADIETMEDYVHLKKRLGS